MGTTFVDCYNKDYWFPPIPYRLFETDRQPLPTPPNYDTTIFDTGHPGNYASAHLLPNGRVVLVDSTLTDKNSFISIYNPANNTLITPTLSWVTNTNDVYVQASILLPNGKVFICTSSEVDFPYLVYDPADNSITEVTDKPFTGDYLYFASSVTLMSDGRVYILPTTASGAPAIIYDYKSNSAIAAGGFIPPFPTRKYWQATLLPNGTLALLGAYGDIAIYDPATDDVTEVLVPQRAVNNVNYFWGGLLLTDGRIYCNPYLSNNKAQIYDPVNNTLTIPSPVFNTTSLGHSYYWRSILLPDGRVYHWTHRKDLPSVIYNPYTDTLTNSVPGVEGTGSAPYYGATLLRDGRILVYTLGTGTMKIVGVSYPKLLTNRRVLSAYSAII